MSKIKPVEYLRKQQLDYFNKMSFELGYDAPPTSDDLDNDSMGSGVWNSDKFVPYVPPVESLKAKFQNNEDSMFYKRQDEEEAQKKKRRNRKIVIAVVVCVVIAAAAAVGVGMWFFLTKSSGCGEPGCLNGGACVDGQCSCTNEYTGLQCESEIGSCSSDPCQNGGTCTAIDALNYTCSCTADYTGINCELPSVDNCASSPCLNGAMCINSASQFSCVCLPGYTGDLCQSVIDNCASEPCQNGGVCKNGVNAYACSCAVGLVGRQCQTVVNNCQSSPCKNSAPCTNGINTYSCACLPGYTDDTCATVINNCASMPCQYGSTCTNSVNAFSCRCVAGYSGTLCETQINFCDSSPCQNGGTCTPAINEYSCQCVNGYTGDNCQLVLALYGFYATTTSPTTVAVNPYPYNVIEVDADLSFNSASANTYKCLQSGIYWIFMTVVWDGLTWSGFNLNGLNSNPQPTVFRQHTMFNSYDTLSRDFIRQVNSSQVLSTQSQYPTWANNMTGTAWGAFQIDNLMTQTIAFEVYSTAPTFTGTFENIVLNIGNGWSVAGQFFMAPVTGTYYFSYSSGSTAFVWLNIIVGSTQYCDNEIYTSHNNGLDVASRGCLLALTAGSTAKMYVYDSALNGMSTFRGFLYAPAQGDPVAWSVHASGGFNIASGPVRFDTVIVNSGLVWQAASYIASIPITGTYYIEMVGQPYYGYMDMRLTQNGANVLSRLWTGFSTRYLTRSRSILAVLSAGDTLVVNCVNCTLTGDGCGGLSFQGILLFST